MDKKELIKKFEAGELKVAAAASLTNNSGVTIVDYVYGTDDKVFGFIASGGKKQYFLVKLQYLAEKIKFQVGSLRFDLDEFVRA